MRQELNDGFYSRRPSRLAALEAVKMLMVWFRVGPSITMVGILGGGEKRTEETLAKMKTSQYVVLVSTTYWSVRGLIC